MVYRIHCCFPVELEPLLQEALFNGTQPLEQAAALLTKVRNPGTSGGGAPSAAGIAGEGLI